jgi:hypothetical protein
VYDAEKKRIPHITCTSLVSSGVPKRRLEIQGAAMYAATVMVDVRSREVAMMAYK